MNTELKIYVDLDGTVADFIKKFLEISGGKHFYDMSKSKAWGIVNNYNNTVEPFFENLPKMEDADEMFSFLTSNFANIEILTATGTTPIDVVAQKKKWVAKHFGDIKTNHVLRGPEKAAYAAPNHVLIDDKDYVLKAFIDAGGIGILHVNAKQTIEGLKELLNRSRS